MKYIITESQFELLSESQEYLNFLLDKMNETGYESLTEYEKDALIRISQGEQVYEEPDETEDEEEEGGIFNPNREFLRLISKYQELEVDDVLFKMSLLGSNFYEILSDYHNFSVEPNFEEGQVIFYNSDTDDYIPIKFKEVPSNTEEMKSLVGKFVFKKLPEIISREL
jgi:hypothetical protein